MESTISLRLPSMQPVASFDATALAADPALELSYYVAPPRMRLYEEYNTKIYSIYLKYIAPEDIHVYSIDEVFLDVTIWNILLNCIVKNGKIQPAYRHLLPYAQVFSAKYMGGA